MLVARFFVISRSKNNYQKEQLNYVVLAPSWLPAFVDCSVNVFKYLSGGEFH